MLSGVGSVLSCANLVNPSKKALTMCQVRTSALKVKAILIEELKTIMLENVKF